MKKIIKKILDTPILFTFSTIIPIIIYIRWCEPKTIETTFGFLIALCPIIFCNIYLWELYFGHDILK